MENNKYNSQWQNGKISPKVNEEFIIFTRRAKNAGTAKSSGGCHTKKQENEIDGS